MKCLKPVLITKNLDHEKFPDGLWIPCGQCMSCRILKREEWVLRIMHEAEYWKESIFVTLTYDDNHLPVNESLVKKDLQDFFKRLRKNSGKKLKYFACGEYGEETGRPHYHAIIFGMDFLNETDRDLIKMSWDKCKWDTQKKAFGDVCGKSIRYVVAYIEKKIVGKQEKYAYENIQSPFHILSNGLGKEYAKANKERIEKDGYISIQGTKRGVPRYYSEVLGLSRLQTQEFALQNEKRFVKELTGLDVNKSELHKVGTENQKQSVMMKSYQQREQRFVNMKAKRKIKDRRGN
nr:MAG: replication initiator protein [Microvirus sp.]